MASARGNTGGGLPPSSPAEPPEATPASSATSVRRWRAEALETAQDHLAEEVPVALCYNGICHAVMMASPGDLEEFALGFSLSEGILGHPDELYDLAIRTSTEGIEIDLTIPARLELNLKRHKRNLTGRTGCGLCGIDSLQNAIKPIRRVARGATISDASVQRALARLRAHQPLQALTGAVHGAAWCSIEGDILHLREDVGRHNALDKLIGTLARNGIDPSTGFLLMSSRASYEIVHKAAAAGIATLVALSAPTAMAVRLAGEAGIEVIGFARPGCHVRYGGSAEG
jgi:FdhD protein